MPDVRSVKVRRIVTGIGDHGAVTIVMWVKTALLVVVVISGIAQMVGVNLRRRARKSASNLHLAAGEPTESWSWRRLLGAVRAWTVRPRAKLRWSDWDPYGGFMFLPVLLGGGLVWGGGTVLVTTHQQFRLGGALALSGGLALVVLCVLFVRRPTHDNAGRFELRSRGYDPAEVDAFLDDICHKNPADIRMATFHTARPGYHPAAVDDALDGYAIGRPVATVGKHRSRTETGGG
jgi:DivIVA domain-containing protein